MLEGFHPDGDELKNSLLSSPSGADIIALPENLVKAEPLRVAGLCPSGSESKNNLPAATVLTMMQQAKCERTNSACGMDANKQK